MTIAGDAVLSIKDIYVGEVWVCSGQSNMERKMSPHARYQTITNYQQEKEAARYPLIRQYTVPYKQSDTLVADAKGSWTVCSPSTIESFSAVAYFFARDLHKARKVPVGLLLASVGGTQAQFWTSRLGLAGNPELLPLVQAYDAAMKVYPEKLAEYELQKDSLLAAYQKELELAKKENKPKPRPPVPPQNPAERRRISCYYNGMIAPLTKFPVKGVLWYQGESDRDFALQYQLLFPTLITDWRKSWKLGDIPFLYVQIAPFKENNPELRESQLLTLKKRRNTAMVVTTDCGDPDDIHPPFKQPIGHRLSLAARALAYNESLAYSGPIYDAYTLKADSVEISFRHVQGGLHYQGIELRGFTIAGPGGAFVSAKAMLRGDKVVVFSDAVSNPVAVRYGWANVPDGNLYNGASLPASPFRTDVVYHTSWWELK
nr:sialate O-acetylesterase [Pedobacter sp. SYSU D00535]